MRSNWAALSCGMDRRRGQKYPVAVAAAGEAFNLTKGEAVSNQGGST